MSDTHEFSAVAVFKGTLKPETFAQEFPYNFLEKIFGSFAKFYPYEETFQQLKLIDKPTKNDINRLWSIIVNQIDTNFRGINTYEEFRQALKENSNFAEFCLQQSPDFQLKLIEYLAN